MRRLIILLVVCCSLVVNAQVPGYMGKRLAVGYHMDVTPVFDYNFYRLPQASYNSEKAWGGLWLANRHNIDVEWVAGRKISLQASVGFSRNGLFSFDYEDGLLAEEYPKISSASYYASNPYYIDNPPPKPYDYIRTRNTMYKIGINLFNKNYIAPHGNYWNISMLMNRSHFEYVVNGEAKDLTLIKSYGILFSKGYRRVIKDAFVLDAGFGMGWLFDDGGKSNLIKTHLKIQNSAEVFHWHLGIKYLLPI